MNNKKLFTYAGICLIVIIIVFVVYYYFNSNNKLQRQQDKFYSTLTINDVVICPGQTVTDTKSYPPYTSDYIVGNLINPLTITSPYNTATTYNLKGWNPQNTGINASFVLEYKFSPAVSPVGIFLVQSGDDTHDIKSITIAYNNTTMSIAPTPNVSTLQFLNFENPISPAITIATITITGNSAYQVLPQVLYFVCPKATTTTTTVVATTTTTMTTIIATTTAKHHHHPDDDGD
jgi:hypothetical protein